VSDSVRPERAAFAELEQLVKHLGDELASFRRRALQAEARLKSLETTGVKGVVSPERVQFLERKMPVSPSDWRLPGTVPSR